MTNPIPRSLAILIVALMFGGFLAGCESEAAVDESSTFDPFPQSAPAVAPVCVECGVITSISEHTRKGEGSGLGAASGAVLGGVIGHTVGDKDVITVVSAIGGGLAGHEIEKRIKSETYYEIVVEMDEGGRAVSLYAEPHHGLNTGDNVKVVGDTIRRNIDA